MPQYPHVPKRREPLYPHVPRGQLVPQTVQEDAAFQWDNSLFVEKHHVLLGIGEPQTYHAVSFRKLPDSVQQKVSDYYQRVSMGGYYYMGGWKPGDYAIYSDFGLRSLYIVQILPWPVDIEEQITVGAFGGIEWKDPEERKGGSVRARVVDTTLTGWDTRGRVEPWNEVGTEHYYNYTNLYHNINDLVRQQGYTYPHVQQRIMRDMRAHPGWEVLKEYGLLNPEEESKRREKQRMTLRERAEYLLENDLRQKASLDEINFIITMLPHREGIPSVGNQVRQDLRDLPLFEAIAEWVKPGAGALADVDTHLANVAEAMIDRYEYQYNLQTVRR